VRQLSRLLAPYAAALAALAFTTGAMAVLLHTTLPRGIYGMLFLLVILASAWWGGYGPGILSTVFTLTLVPYAATPDFGASKINYTQMVLVLLIAILVSRVAASRNEREKVLRDANELLDERVHRRTEELERANISLQEREALLLRQADELARSNADLQQFAYVASHDLQEPLRLIAIYTELLKRRYHGQIDHEADRFMGVIVDGVHRMETLIRDLLSYSRVIHAEQPMEREQVDVAEAVKVATANLELVIRESGASIHWDSLPVIACDRLELTQVFQNLLSNALKYRGGAAPRIDIGVTPSPTECVISVRDNGIGIHPDYHETIFSPFKRLHGREYPGTGIGLALCRRIVERQGGRIWVESAPGEGATFYFSIPREVRKIVRAAELSGYSSGR
jgi:signal transduction histidine kinase